MASRKYGKGTEDVCNDSERREEGVNSRVYVYINFVD
jgi:hypothetical protein